MHICKQIPYQRSFRWKYIAVNSGRDLARMYFRWIHGWRGRPTPSLWGCGRTCGIWRSVRPPEDLAWPRYLPPPPQPPTLLRGLPLVDLQQGRFESLSKHLLFWLLYLISLLSRQFYFTALKAIKMGLSWKKQWTLKKWLPVVQTQEILDSSKSLKLDSWIPCIPNNGDSWLPGIPDVGKLA